MENELIKANELRAELAPVVKRAQEMVIVTPEDYEGAAEFCKTVKGAQKRVVDFFAPMVKANLEATRATNAAKAQVLDPLMDAEGAIKKKQLNWSAEQERIRLAEEARLNAIEQERARKEREKAEVAARLQREKEQAAQREAAEAMRKASETKKAALRERLQLEAQALQKAANDAAAKAQAKEDAAANVQASTITVASVAPEVKGQSIRKTWKARIVNPRAAIVALMQYPDWSAYIEINQGQLDKLASRLNGAMKLDGVEIYEAATLASSSK